MHRSVNRVCGNHRASCLAIVAGLALGVTLTLSHPVSAQEEKAAEKAAAQKARSEAAAKQQASPEPAKDEQAAKPEGEKEDDKKPKDPMSTPTFNGLRFRSIGPAFTSGRVIGFAVDPNNPARYFVACRIGRCLEDYQQRHDLDAGLRSRRLVFDRRDRARSEKPSDRLGRHRREQQPAQRLVWQRRLSLR